MSAIDLSTVHGRFDWYWSERLIPWLAGQPGVSRASQNELARRLDVNSSTLGNWRRGKTEPDEFALARIAVTAGDPDPSAVARWIKHGSGPTPEGPGPGRHAAADGQDRGGLLAPPLVMDLRTLVEGVQIGTVSVDEAVATIAVLVRAAIRPADSSLPVSGSKRPHERKLSFFRGEDLAPIIKLDEVA